jgi:hypothetical protein
MADQRRTVTLPHGTFQGVDVPIKESNERWSEVILADGATLRIKPNVLVVTRIEGQYDPEGNPMYALTANQVMTVVNVPAHLRKSAGGTKAN